VNRSRANPSRASSCSIWSMIPGSARSASVIDKPQVGQATQAMLHRRTVEISSVSFTPRRRRIASSRGRSASSRSANRML